MTRTAILDVVGLTRDLIGEHTPNLKTFAERHRPVAIEPAFPAVTCTAQSNYLTGSTPAGHGIVGNGWYDRTLAEVQFWKQSNHLVAGEKLWEAARRRRPGFTCAKLFWWYNMYSSVDYSITPRPMYPADGRKIFDVYTWPFSIRTEIKRDLGDFPFPGFWGPAAGVRSPQGAPDAATRWIAESAKWIESKYSPSLSLVYLPHLDYNLQRRGTVAASVGPGGGGGGLNPEIAPDLKSIDAIVGDLLRFYGERGVQVIILSEYGIENVDQPIHLNRVFREKGWLVVKEELGLELLDAGASRVFAVADHQVAHVYVNDRSLQTAARDVVASVSGVERVLGSDEKRSWGIDHPRAGDLVAIAKANAWFTYYYWLENARAPDFARCVDIHRKPGYDPVELFTDPALSPFALKAKIGWRLLQKKLGFRMLMDVIPLDASLVRGSHGARPVLRERWPILMGPGIAPEDEAVASVAVRDLLLNCIA